LLAQAREQLEAERDMLACDLAEAEANLLRLSEQLRDLDCDIMEICDENEELEIANQDIATQHEKDRGKLISLWNLVEEQRA
jgi:uncharacterized protein (DUF3084 family)